ncbi:protocatechuate 3,4-dioxygenase subunit alpha [Georgenia thermotolerans]|uniref:Protocatechuate 3,4-dioxygenase subunit alpha n=1 Tax=Georgenia thermotolerans TaxID=527326 RepID=A0A7J5UTK3_9MICO|nr:protocatechuate 3,4-dioxygenase subunit alpha [Georgenia thermotolerans]KAE8765609.1 protocatechuate 3,4-dioxygenase subunit alpha [Georgenia thermotolerans]
MGIIESRRGAVFENWPPDNSSNEDYRTWPPTPGLAPSPGITPSQAVGPYSGIALPYEAGPDVAGPRRPGVLSLAVTVYDGAGQPLPDALVEIWQPDETGHFTVGGGIYTPVAPDGFRGFGRAASGPDGTCEFRTVKPGAVITVDGAPQAPCIALTLFAGGVLKMLVTRVYFADEEVANSTDTLLMALPEERRRTLLAHPVEGGYRFDVHLQGPDETVFFDVFGREHAPAHH